MICSFKNKRKFFVAPRLITSLQCASSQISENEPFATASGSGNPRWSHDVLGTVLPFFAFCNTSYDLLPKYVSTSLLRIQFNFFMPSLIFLMSHFEQSSQNNHSWKPNHLQDYTNSILGRKLHRHWHSTVLKNSLAGKGLKGHRSKDASYYYYYWSLLLAMQQPKIALCLWLNEVYQIKGLVKLNPSQFISLKSDQ